MFWNAAIPGFLTGLSLIVVIGAQNSYVLRQGLLRHHVGPVVAVCAISDAMLIVAGVAGIGTLVDRAGPALEIVRWLGVAFLVGYAAIAVRSAFSGDSLQPEARAKADSRGTVVGRALALTWLNPHVYLDTVVLLGSVAATYSAQTAGPIDGRWWFALGAMLASLVWFSAIGFGARALRPLLTQPRAWQVLDLLIAATMLIIAFKLATG